MIIDEFSMVSYQTFTFIHSRLTEIKGTYDTEVHLSRNGLSSRMAIVKSEEGRDLTHLLHLPSVYASVVKFRVRFACCGINVGALKYEYMGCRLCQN